MTDESTLPARDAFLMLIVSSPSGAGKTTLCNRVREQHSGLRFSVSHTTRKPRGNEKDGREYHFVDEATFEAMVARGDFAEWAKVHDHYSVSYTHLTLPTNREV